MIRRTLAAAALLLTLTACAHPAAPSSAGAAPPSAGASATGASPADGRDAEIYAAVIRRFLASDSSFGPNHFATTYVLDRADGAPIAEPTRRRVTAALADVTAIRFVTDRASVLTDPSGCAAVRDGAILITLGAPAGGATSVRVGVYGFVACQGAVRLTYLVDNTPGRGWTVTTTTGGIEVA